MVQEARTNDYNMVGLNNMVLETNYSLKNVESFPFTTRLSFRLLIEFWKKKLNSADKGEALLAQKIAELAKQTPAFLSPIEDENLLQEHREFIEILMSGFFPTAFAQSHLGLAARPFDDKPFYRTPYLKKMVLSQKVKFQAGQSEEFERIFLITRACCQILNKFYNQHITLELPIIYTATPDSRETESHYKAQLNTTFVEIVAKEPLKELSENQINQLLSNFYDLKLWLEYLPPENFEFVGVTCINLTDITEEEVLSRMKYKLLERDAIVTQENVEHLQQYLRTYFCLPELRLGISAIDYPMENSVAHRYKIQHSLLAPKYPLSWDRKSDNSIYEKACRYKDILIIEDLTKVLHSSRLEKDLQDVGIRNIIVAPLATNTGIIGILELGSPNPHDLNSLAMLKLREILPLFAIAVERSREEVENRIQAIIREEYTAIHPSVEWKFREASFALLESREEQGHRVDARPVRFHDVYPLYGQADIVSSSEIRNMSIQADFLDNLGKIQAVLETVSQEVTFPLTEKYLAEVERYLLELKTGISSSDEPRINDFIKYNIHLFFQHIKNKNVVISKAVRQYYESLDAEYGVIYERRKAYEQSVERINEILSNYLEEEDERMQQILPYYFEKFKTDGVEYQIYIGQSLLQRERFHTIHLQNLRLWQLISMCEITRMIDNIKSTLPIPLITAQLIFVYSSPLSIQFRLDDKQFDVEGAYNVRYEILKKRIDKALIKGTDKRLTESGKIAVVYNAESDREEYLEYFEFLKQRGYIENFVEDIELDDLQGVQGLKAFRLSVLLEKKPKSSKKNDK